ncbi:hypothetical protein E4U23_002107 [Claviceps purpurea]|nr:hypothetical protein E4U23_002107 [Claviceps purpurea]
MHHVLASYYLCTLNGEAIDAVVSSVFYDAKKGLYDAHRGKAEGLKDQWKHNCINNMTVRLHKILSRRTSEKNVPSQTAETFLAARSRRMARTLCMHSHWIDFRTYSDSSNISKCL